MKKKILSFALALTMCLGLLPGTAFADESNPPDWYFLFAIFKNVDADCLDADKVTRHAKYAMTQDEVEVARSYAKEFEMYMNQLGVMRAHVDVVEIDTPITELQESDSGSYLGSKQAASLLDSKVDLDQYDHVTCIVSLNVHTGYGGITGSEFENATGQSCINFVNRDWCLSVWAVGVYPWAPGYPVHEYLHFMERMNKRWGRDFDLHIIMENFYERVNNEYEECYTDIILNRAKGTAGTGVIPEAWQYPPRLIRTMRETVHEVTIPSDISVIGDKAFQHFANLSEVKFHSGVTAIGVAAFEWCTSLTEVNIPSSVIKIGDWAFQGCTTLTEMSIPASVTSIGYAAFWNTEIADIYYSGTEDQWKAIQTGEFNDPLTKANIHYNSTGIPKTANPTNDKLEVNGTAANPTVYKINGSNYFKIRDVAALLNGTEKQFAVGYDGGKNAVTATTGQGYAKQPGDLAGAPAGGSQTAEPSNDAIYVNGEKITAEVYKIGGSNYFKLRDLGKALNFYVGWSADRGMYIETDKPYSE